MNADIMVADSGFAATIYPVISGYQIQDARVEHIIVDGNRQHNPTKVDGCRTAGIYLYRGDHCFITDCVVTNYQGDGISFQQSNDVKVNRCVVEQCAGFGLHPGSGSQRPVVTQCRAKGNDEDGFSSAGGFEAVLPKAIGKGQWRLWHVDSHKDSDNFVRKNTIIGNHLGGVYWRSESDPWPHTALPSRRIPFETMKAGAYIDGITRGTVLRRNIIEDTGNGRQKSVFASAVVRRMLPWKTTK